jgi:hypothetical protein
VALGGSGDLARTFGVDPSRARLATRVRGEAAWARYDDAAATPFAAGTAADARRRSAPYARGMAEATLSRPLGRLAASVTGAAGAVARARAVPAQRLFYVGRLQTVRGQFAQPYGPGYAGTAFWLTRTELGLDRSGVRPALFYDAGWAGAARALRAPGAGPLSGVGAGLSFLDGLLRTDVSRGIAPAARLARRPVARRAVLSTWAPAGGPEPPLDETRPTCAALAQVQLPASGTRGRGSVGVRRDTQGSCSRREPFASQTGRPCRRARRTRVPRGRAQSRSASVGCATRAAAQRGRRARLPRRRDDWG